LRNIHGALERLAAALVVRACSYLLHQPLFHQNKKQVRVLVVFVG